jgi:hypothetical protein
MAEAAASLNRIDDLSKDSSVDIASMQKMALMQEKFKGKSGVQQLALAQATPEKIKSILSMPEGQAKTNAMKALGASNEKELKDRLGIEADVLATRVTTGLASAETSQEIKDFMSGKKSFEDLSGDAAAIAGVQGINASASGSLSYTRKGVGKPKLTALGGGIGDMKKIERTKNYVEADINQQGEDWVGGTSGIFNMVDAAAKDRSTVKDAVANNLAATNGMDPKEKANKSSPKNLNEFMSSSNNGMIQTSEGVSNLMKMISDQIPESFGKGGEIIKKAILEAFGEAADSMKGKGGGRGHNNLGGGPSSIGNPWTNFSALFK